MNKTQCIGFDVHKKWIYYCAKAPDGEVLEAGRMASRREALEQWAKGRKEAWRGALEATLFSGWIYDELKPHAVELLVAHPAMMKAILASKKKNDRADAATIADLLRCNLLTKCYMAPEWIRELRRLLRYRSRVVRQVVQMKNRIAGVLMETGTPYEDRRLHGKRYFTQLVKTVSVPASVRQVLGLNRAGLEMFHAVERRLIRQLKRHPELGKRVELLKSISGVGDVLALTWALEIGEVSRVGSIRRACSYCGLTSAQRQSGEKNQHGPISKQRNAALQTALVEAAKLAPRWNAELKAVHQKVLAHKDRNAATLAVARKLVAYLMAVDRSGRPFQARAGQEEAALPV